MIYSMTAYACAQEKTPGHLLVWEMRSVNHRYLDVSFRLPETLRFLEPKLRELVKDRLKRGKVECQLKLISEGQEQALEINQSLLQSLLSAGAQISQNFALPFDLAVSDVLRWPEVISQKRLEGDVLAQTAVHGFEQAITSLCEARAFEGARLQSYLEAQLSTLKHTVIEARSEAARSASLMRDKMLTRLASLSVDVATQRIEQELALALIKMDVTEEIDRLLAHCDEVSRVLRDEQTQGKRLDFLVQELNREANTLGAKSDSVLLTKYAVEIKVLIEQMREQIQNIE